MFDWVFPYVFTKWELSCLTFYSSGNTEFSFTACSLQLQLQCWLCFMWQDPEFKQKNLYKNYLLRASFFVTFLLKLTRRSVREKIAVSSSFGPFKEQIDNLVYTKTCWHFSCMFYCILWQHKRIYNWCTFGSVFSWWTSVTCHPECA